MHGLVSTVFNVRCSATNSRSAMWHRGVDRPMFVRFDPNLGSGGRTCLCQGMYARSTGGLKLPLHPARRPLGRPARAAPAMSTARGPGAPRDDAGAAGAAANATGTDSFGLPPGPARQGRHAEYGQRWGEGAARCFCIEGDFLDPDQGPRPSPVAGPGVSRPLQELRLVGPRGGGGGEHCAFVAGAVSISVDQGNHLPTGVSAYRSRPRSRIRSRSRRRCL